MPVLRLLAVLLCLAPARAPATVVHDHTRLERIAVERVVRPRSVEEVQRLVRGHPGPIAIAGGRFSMGGQIATDDALVLDMRGLDRVLAVDPVARTVTVEAGVTWRGVQEAIDPYGLSVKVMQSYASFTVGGALSVNAHGRYVNGGYGALGPIVAATLDVVPNVRLERHSRELSVAEYRAWFRAMVRASPAAVLHNADLYPPRYDRVRAITWAATDRPVTVRHRLRPRGGRHRGSRFLQWVVADVPLGKTLREQVLDPVRLRGSPVVWRNYEASYDVAELEPRSRWAAAGTSRTRSTRRTPSSRRSSRSPSGTSSSAPTSTRRSSRTVSRAPSPGSRASRSSGGCTATSTASRARPTRRTGATTR